LYPLEKSKSLGVCFETGLSFRDIPEKLSRLPVSYESTNFIYMDEHFFILLYKLMVRPHVEYTK